MQITTRRFTVVVLFAILFSALETAAITAQAGAGGGAKIEVRDGIAVGVFRQSGGAHKLGKVTNGQVNLSETYGGVAIQLKDLEGAVSKIGDVKFKDGKEEKRAIINELLSQSLPGIWKAESASISGVVTPAEGEKASYLIIRADKTFRVVKKGRSPEGKWSLDSKSQFVMDAKNDKSMTAETQRLPGDKLELKINEGGTKITMLYSRTQLTKEPKTYDGK